MWFNRLRKRSREEEEEEEEEKEEFGFLEYSILGGNKMGLPMIPPFYLQNGTIEDRTDGSSQATILNTGNLSFDSQMRQPFETIPILKLQLGQTNAADLVQSSISLGQDDYIQLLLQGSFRLRQKRYSLDSACILVKQIIQVVQNPLGCNATNRTNQSDDRYHREENNQSILLHNVMLSEQLLDTNANLFQPRPMFCDAYQGLMPILCYRKCYGFTECCRMGRYGGMAGGRTKEMACSDSLLAHWIWSGKPIQLCRLINATGLVQSSLFYISPGKDDYIQLFPHGAFGLREQCYSLNPACILVKQMIQVVQNHFNAKARKIICMGIGPLGCAPCSLWEAYNASNQTSADVRYRNEEINQRILPYNVMLSEQLLALSTNSFDAQTIFCDAYQGLMQILDVPKGYGFNDVRPKFSGMGHHGGMAGCPTKEIACSDLCLMAF